MADARDSKSADRKVVKVRLFDSILGHQSTLGRWFTSDLLPLHVWKFQVAMGSENSLCSVCSRILAFIEVANPRGHVSPPLVFVNIHIHGNSCPSLNANKTKAKSIHFDFGNPAITRSA
jgi:hypothetical protein